MCEHHCEIDKQKEKKSLTVIVLTVITMIAEISYGYITNSMGLLADGFHMGTHALALSLTYAAYVLIRKFDNSDIFPNGADKIGTLTAYTSALFLGFTGIWIIAEALGRLLHPIQIQFNEAICVAVIGLIVNAACIFIMGDTDHCSHAEKDGCKHKKDYNYKAAYYHILADVLTSILAIIALITGKYFNIVYFDAFAGIIGGMLIIKWSGGLLTDTVKILLDMKK